jgi:hypothetical protein
MSGPKNVPIPLLDEEAPSFMTGSDQSRSAANVSFWGSKGRLEDERNNIIVIDVKEVNEIIVQESNKTRI